MTASTDLLPPDPPPTVQHEIRITRQVGPIGGPTRTYRGARIEANEKGTIYSLVLAGCPMDGVNMGNWETVSRARFTSR